MDAADLDYELPESAIAQTPVEPRDSARLLVAGSAGVEHRTVAELDRLLEPGDVLVVNDTRVIPARLRLRKSTGGAVEVLLLHPLGGTEWEALVRPSRRVPAGTELHPEVGPGRGGAADVTVTVGEPVGDDGRRRVSVAVRGAERPQLGADASPGTDDEPTAALDDLAWLEAVGEVPLPPYIHAELHDPARYQTVYATRPGSVAAPTAGLHLTEDLLARVTDRGVTVARVELVVGLGTFRPITTDRVEDHPMHSERYRIPDETAALLAPRIAGRSGTGAGGNTPGGSVVAVGTTVVRALESWAATGEQEGDTELFIHGSYPFALVDRLLTNFHVPRSSLLALVESFAGPGWRDVYATALAEGYRFLSFGDATLLDRGALDGTGPA